MTTMRPPLIATVPLLLLLLLCCATGRLAAFTAARPTTATMHRCMFDEMMARSDSRSVKMVQELPRKGQSAWRAYTASTGVEGTGDWEPVRIVVSKLDLDDPNKYCTQEGQQRPTFQGYAGECREDDVLTSRKKAELLQTILPSAIKLHSERLLVQRMSTSLVVPVSIRQTQCRHFTVPVEHHTNGVPDADTVLYLAAGPSAIFAVPCVTAHKNSRPTVGAMNFYLSGVFHPWFAVRVAAHELAHVLGFSYQQMEAKGVVRTLTTGDYASKSGMVTSTLTKKKAQEHFNCSRLEGMPLRDEYDDASRPHSHWDQRYAKDELMGPTVATGAGFYTALTMAAFEDMGFYKANFSMAEPMRWGKDVGCEFVDEKQCRPDDHTKFPAMFCQKNYSDTMSYCTSDRVALGQCSSSWNDECLFIRSLPFGSCRNEENTALHGSRLGAGSWCLDAESLKVNVETYDPEPMVVAVAAVCAEVACARGSVRVRYLGDNDWYDCPEGSSLSPAGTSVDFASGKIKCPKYDEVCTITPTGRSGVTRHRGDDDELATGDNYLSHGLHRESRCRQGPRERRRPELPPEGTEPTMK
ncbi:putative surface protease GP63 [Trypanosoma rangeli]|uniref:Leishmanolysin-like peptidase n=1 Tax=Trypanosoma rangeli TaxID=5698 RepID=A0A422NDS2_TRYRA|nr:putative surface protease GP63 [Trypanosoma rangeli]RNF03654.1 putative surface protease GP63 [Trypanosoma rangeli]|eukprot:RNF03654.1 putative surface protease GP63 [Trypanosoma rangeli]